MQPYYAGHGIATVLFAVTLVLWLGIEMRQELKRRTDATRHDRGSRLVLSVSFVGAALLAAFARSRATELQIPNGALTFAVGLLLMWIGIGIRFWSHQTLGRYFTLNVMTSEDQPVIDTGPYHFVRHPSYAGLLLIFAGFGVLQSNWLALAAVVVLPFIGLAYRMRVEESAL